MPLVAGLSNPSYLQAYFERAARTRLETGQTLGAPILSGVPEQQTWHTGTLMDAVAFYHRLQLGMTMKLRKRIDVTATDIYPDIYFVQEIFAVVVFLTVVSAAVIINFL
jgi:hypothetical protein